MKGTTMRNQKGQALVELGIIVVLLVTITIGAAEFGYTFLVLHMVTQATAAGARAASAAGGNRDACGRIVNCSPSGCPAIESLVRSQIGALATVATVNVQQCDLDCQPGDAITGDGSTTPCSTSNIPKVRVTVGGSIPRIFGLLGSSPLSFTRSETFRDEGR